MPTRMGSRRYSFALSLSIAALLLTCWPNPGLRAAETGRPAYPRINLSTWYKVDPSWPQRPAGVKWGEMPSVAVDGKDQVWLFTRAEPPVQVYTASGKFVRAFGEGLIGSAHYLRFDHQGNVWLADVGKHVVLQFTSEGKLLRTLGTPGERGSDQAHFNEPTDMAVTPEGEVFIADGYGNSRVVHFDRNGKFVEQWGKLGVGPGEFSLVHSIVLDGQGRLYVADRNNARVQVFDQSGKFLDQWHNLLVPWGLCLKGDELWVCGSSPMPWRETDGALGCPPKDQLFMRFSLTGRLRQLWTIPKGEDGKEQPGELNWVHGIAVDSQGNIYAGDIKGRRAQKFVLQK